MTDDTDFRTDDVEVEDVQQDRKIKSYYDPELNQQIDEQFQTRVAQKDNYSIASLVLGIVGIIFGGVICGILAVVFSRISVRDYGKSGFSTAGFILGIIDIVLGALVVFLVIAMGVLLFAFM